ncbi:hypothetical protein JR338_09675 [Chloroflexota bacterium]|nr:hypothetical protein JR338_09675 [Chloroflexota bacterium]
MEIGTPKDYSSDMYFIYFEVGEINEQALKIIQEYLGPEKKNHLRQLPHGYEIEMPIQCVPDVVRELVGQDIGIYQIVRYAKSDKSWE